MGNRSKKAKKKLDSRRKGWEDMGGAQISPNTKMVQGASYRKPGSLNPKK